MKDKRHIVFDLETLGNGPTAPIIQIGAVEYVNGKSERIFGNNIKYDSFDGFTLDYSSIMWWFQQAEKAREMLMYDHVTLPEALTRFIQWVGDTENTLFWSMSNFDAPILSHALRQSNLPEFPFWQFRDFRTIIGAAGLERGEFEGVKHYALDDAINEGDLIMKAIYQAYDFGNIDLELLKKQKQGLLFTIQEEENEQTEEALQGILNLLDSIQDHVEDNVK